MKNKKIYLKNTYFAQTKNLSFFESRFLELRQQQEERWQQPKLFESGTGVAESILDEFDRTYAPEDLTHAVNNPNRVTFGVRDSLMQGPLGAMNVLSHGSILDQRVRNRLQHLASIAPEEFPEIIDSYIRFRGGPSKESARRGARERMEREIAQELYSYQNRPGYNYATFERDIQNAIIALPMVAGGAFRDDTPTPAGVIPPGLPINFANPNAVNEFNVATGAPVIAGGQTVPAQEKVVIKWHEEDYSTISEKLKKAGRWAQFQDVAIDFLILKFNLSEVQKVIHEENAKLSNDRFDPKRLMHWLEREWTTQSLQEDTQFRNFVNGDLLAACVPGAPLPGGGLSPGINSQEELERIRPDMARRLKQEQEAARKKIGDDTLINQLRKILPANTLENISDSETTRALVSYLYHATRDELHGPEVRTYIRELAGVTDESTLQKRFDGIKQAETFLGKFDNNFVSLISEREDTKEQRDSLNWEKAMIASNPAQIKRLNAIDVSLAKISQKIIELEKQIIPQITQLRDLLSNNLNDEGLFGIDVKKELKDSGIETICENKILKGLPITNAQKNDYVDEFVKEFYTKPNFRDALEKLKSEHLVKSKETTETALNDSIAKKEKGAQKLDSRSLLFEIVKRDIQRKGLIDSTNIDAEAHYTVNVLIAKLHNAEELNRFVTESIAKGIESPVGGRLLNAINRAANSALDKWDGIETKSAEEAVKDLVGTDPGLTMFAKINVNSSRADMVKMMQMFGEPSTGDLERFSKKLMELVKGVVIEYKEQKIEGLKNRVLGLFGRAPREKIKKLKIVVRRNNIPLIENLVHTITLINAQLNTQHFIQNVREAEEKEDRADAQHRLLKEQTDDYVGTVEYLSQGLEKDDAQFKKMQIRANAAAEFENTMKEWGKFSPDEEIYMELARKGVSKEMVERGKFFSRGLFTETGFWSIKRKYQYKKFGKSLFTSPLSPLTWPIYVPYALGKGTKMAAWDWMSDERKTQIKEGAKKLFVTPAVNIITTPFRILGWCGNKVAGTINWITGKKEKQVN